MRLSEMIGGEKDAPTHSIDEIAKKHKASTDDVRAQLEKGVKVETEHTSDEKIATEIALDHLWEFPDYYDRLAQAEQ